MSKEHWKKNVEDFYPLSPLQQGMLFHTMMAPDSEVYVEQLSCTLRGELNGEAFRKAWQDAMDRHPVLRTSFRGEGLKEPLQVVHRTVPVHIRHYDWREMPPADQERRLNLLLEEERARGFVPSDVPLLRLALVRRGEDLHDFVWTYHHVLLDGWSVPMLLQEVFAQYQAITQGEAFDLPARRPYRDYIVWLRKQSDSDAERFWREHMRGKTSPTVLGMLRPDAAQTGEAGARSLEVEMSLPSTITSVLQNICRQQHITMNTLLQGVWAFLLGVYSGDDDVLFGVTVSGRPVDLEGSESMLGLFINTLPFKIHLDADQKFLVWLKAVQDRAVAMRQFEYSSLVDIQGWSDIPRGTPLFENIFVFENYPIQELEGRGESSLRIENIRAPEQTNYPVTVVGGVGEELLVRIAYDSQRCGEDVAKRILGHFRTVLEQMAEDPALRLKDIQVVTGTERELMLNDWNGTAEDFGEKTCVAGLIEAQAERAPESVAVRIDGNAITYRQLNVRANRLAHFLQSAGVGPEDIVGICADPSIEVVVAVLAVLKAGGAYLPLDPGFPPERLRYMLEDARASYLLTQRHVAHLFEDSLARQIVLDGEDDFKSWSDLNPVNACSLQNLAYVIFTSGSTGRPKGSLIVHEGLYNLVKATVRDHGITPSSRVLNFFSFGFDGSVLTMFPALAGGATLYLARREELMSPSDLHRLLRQQGITTLLVTPSTLAHIPNRDLPDLETVVCGGEACPRDVGVDWREGRRFVNDYGPTETTVAAAQYPFQGDSDGVGFLPIGRPLSNCRLFVLDRYLRPVPVGVAGELYIAGEGVGRGYLGRPALTAECFLPDPLSTEPGGRMYRTGDLVRFLSDGNLEFLGRIDHQVKIRGFRIELGEIEAVLASAPGVREALAAVREDTAGDKRIIGYIVPEPEGTLSGAELTAYLKTHLPSYMIPSDFVTVSSFPLTPTGKVDRGSLPAPGAVPGVAEGPHLEPRDDSERQLVAIWEEVLQKRPIGVTDNFFDLGGHSFLAVRLLAQIQSQFGKEIPMVALFQDPTVEALARLLRDQDDVSTGATLVQLRKGGSQPPLFVVHPTGGSVHWYASLAKQLNGDRPVLGLQAKGLGGKDDLDTTIEAMASGYVSAIIERDPDGPYNIAGWSLGVIIAFEVARQLRLMGREVSLLAILDQGPEVPIKEDPSDDAELLFNIFSNYFPVDVEYLRTLDNDEQFRFILKRAQRAGIVPPFVRRKNFRHYITINKVQMHAWRMYVAKSYPGRISLFRSEELASRSGGQPDLGWGRLAQGGVDVIDVPGNHMSMMEAPHVRYLAEKMDTLIQSARAVDTKGD